MTAVLFQQRTAEVEAWLAERHSAGLDHRDEVWEDTYVVTNPAPGKHHAWLAVQLVRALWEPAEAIGMRAIEIANVGSPQSYRIPDVTVCDFDQFDPHRCVARNGSGCHRDPVSRRSPRSEAAVLRGA